MDFWSMTLHGMHIVRLLKHIYFVKIFLLGFVLIYSGFVQERIWWFRLAKDEKCLLRAWDSFIFVVYFWQANGFICMSFE